MPDKQLTSDTSKIPIRSTLLVAQAESLSSSLTLLFLSNSVYSPVLPLLSKYVQKLAHHIPGCHPCLNTSFCLEYFNSLLTDFYLQPWPCTLPCPQMYSKNNSQHELSTIKAQIWFLFCAIPAVASHFRVKAKVWKKAFKAPHVRAPFTSLIPPPHALSLPHSGPATTASVLFLEHTGAFCMNTLLCAFPLPVCLLPPHSPGCVLHVFRGLCSSSLFTVKQAVSLTSPETTTAHVPTIRGGARQRETRPQKHQLHSQNFSFEDL